jgi:hypothetical protein
MNRGAKLNPTIVIMNHSINKFHLATTTSKVSFVCVQCILDAYTCVVVAYYKALLIVGIKW